MDDRLKELAGRFTAMHPSNDGERTAYNFAFGALYALARAKELGFPDTKPEVGTSEKRSREINAIAARMKKDGTFVTEGKWLAGYYYNDALLRCDVGYEQLLRHWTNLRRQGGQDELIVKAQMTNFKADLIIPWWPLIRDQVNVLKHRLFCTSPHGPVKVLLPEALEIVSHLIRAVEWAIENRNRRPKSNKTL